MVRNRLAVYIEESELYCPKDMPEAVSHRDYHRGRNMDGRCNITACMPGTRGRRSLVLAAHLDTVPWAMNPCGPWRPPACLISPCF